MSTTTGELRDIKNIHTDADIFGRSCSISCGG